MRERKRIKCENVIGVSWQFFPVFSLSVNSSYSRSTFIPFHCEYCHFSILKPGNLSTKGLLLSRAGWLISAQPGKKLSAAFSAVHIVLHPLGNQNSFLFLILVWVLFPHPLLTLFFFDTLFTPSGFARYYPRSIWIHCFAYSSFVIFLLSLSLSLSLHNTHSRFELVSQYLLPMALTVMWWVPACIYYCLKSFTDKIFNYLPGIVQLYCTRENVASQKLVFGDPSDKKKFFVCTDIAAGCSGTCPNGIFDQRINDCGTAPINCVLPAGADTSVPLQPLDPFIQNPCFQAGAKTCFMLNHSLKNK